MPQSLTQLAPREKRRLKSLCENSVLLHVAPAFQAGTEGRGDTKNARLKGGRYKTVPILSSHTDSEARPSSKPITRNYDIARTTNSSTLISAWTIIEFRVFKAKFPY